MDKLLERRALNALLVSKADFRKAGSLAKELNVSEKEVQAVLEASPKARRPVKGMDVGREDWFRAKLYGFTWREQLFVWQMQAGRGR